jgi:hypoxanthine-DNA glycosylase
MLTGKLTGLTPLVSSQTRVLILGSFPGVASLKAQQYYGHPQNHFWRILMAIWPDSAINTGVSSYEFRSKWLLSKGLGLWDVYAACEREGSLDTSIRNAVPNDIAALAAHCPALQAIAHNGGESFKHVNRVKTALAAAGPAAPAIAFYRLPSSSPANASWSFARKLVAWRAVFEQHGLV